MRGGGKRVIKKGWRKNLRKIQGSARQEILHKERAPRHKSVALRLWITQALSRRAFIHGGELICEGNIRQMHRKIQLRELRRS